MSRPETLARVRAIRRGLVLLDAIDEAFAAELERRAELHPIAELGDPYEPVCPYCGGEPAVGVAEHHDPDECPLAEGLDGTTMLTRALRCLLDRVEAGERDANRSEGALVKSRARVEQLERELAAMTADMQAAAEQIGTLVDEAAKVLAEAGVLGTSLLGAREPAPPKLGPCRSCDGCGRLVDELRDAADELGAARAAVGDAWFAGGATLAEAITRKTTALERLGKP